MDTVTPHVVRRDIGFILNLLIALFLSIALVSYDAGDPAFYQQVNGYVIKNWEGFLGAHLAGFVFYFLGYGAYALPGFLLHQAFYHLKGRASFCMKAMLGAGFLLIGL